MLNNLKIRNRLLLGFGIVLFFLIGISFFSGNRMQMLSELTDKLHKHPLTVSNAVLTANGEIIKMHRSMKDVALAKSNEQIDNAVQSVNQYEQNVFEQFKIIDERFLGDKSMVNDALNAFKGWKIIRDEVINLKREGKVDEAAAITKGKGADHVRKLSTSIDALRDFAINKAIQFKNNAAETGDVTITITMVIAGIALLSGIFIALFITNSLAKPLKLVSERAEQLRSVCITNLGKGLNALAVGNTKVKAEYSTPLLNIEAKDEIGDLARSVDNIIKQAQGGIDSFEESRKKLEDLTSETNSLITNAKNGNLENRGNAEKFEGTYRELLFGINETLDAIVTPIKEGSAVLEEMSTGDLTVRMTGEYKGDYQIIKNSINKLGDSLGNLLRKVSDSVQATASASAEISSSSEEMAAGTQEQSAQTTEVASSVEEMTSTIMQTTQHANTATENAKNAVSIANEGGNIVEQTVSGMRKISEVVQQAAVIVRELGDNSNQIGEIIQVIDDIADQTNLLALNAAIEAARAGEQGRGFAVVADEVRKLAERTTKATKEIADMIKKIQLDTGKAVDSIEAGTREVDKGKELAQKSGTALGQIIQGANETVDVINQVAAAAEQQSSAAELISKSIEGISSVTQQSASGTQQLANTAEDLNKLTDNLHQLVAQFKVDIHSHQDENADSTLSVRSNGRLVNY